MINLATSTTLKYHHVQLGLKFRVLLQPWEFALITTCQHIPMHIVIEMQFFNNYGFRAIALLIHPILQDINAQSCILKIFWPMAIKVAI